MDSENALAQKSGSEFGDDSSELGSEFGSDNEDGGDWFENLGRDEETLVLFRTSMWEMFFPTKKISYFQPEYEGLSEEEKQLMEKLRLQRMKDHANVNSIKWKSKQSV